ncbi:MAG TPA: HEAT repeat domain-containing protein [Planctomycetota bacterium]|nr:HEAT repeat domain-containing protein [Planctomycetota bacterium]
MRFCLVLTVLSLAAGCASPPDESKVGELDFYDWLELRRSEYAVALDGGRESRGAQMELAYKLKLQIDKRYDSIVQRASSEEDAHVRELAVSALGFSQRPEAVAHIEKHLADPVAAVRGTASAAIGILNPPQVPMDKIEALLLDVDLYCRQASLFAIKLLSKPDRKPSKYAIRRITELARDDSDIGVRNEAVLALGMIQDTDSIEFLSREALSDESPLVRGNAARVLGGYGPAAKKAVPELIERLKDGETGVVERAHYALKLITGRVDADPQYGAWSDWLKEISKVLEWACQKDGVVRSAPGSCPKCGIPLEARAIPEAVFACPEHKEVVLEKPGKCPQCQKELLPRKRDAQE